MTDAYTEGALPPPQYIAPAVSVRATWAATDGSRPEEVYVDWKEPPPAAEVIAIVQTLLRGGARVERLARPEELVTPISGREVCPATADLGQHGNLAHAHRCALPPDHEPVEPEGRAHRCECGGLFMADSETVDVIGRSRGDRKETR
jgi:hypothetical protein